MARGFKFLENMGSPTRWDGSRYFKHVESIKHRLTSDLADLVAADRYELSGPRSLWHMQITSINVTKAGLTVTARSDDERRHLEFSYQGFRKVQTAHKFAHMPWFVIQELVLLPNEVLRHTWSDHRGDTTTIWSTSLSFKESLVQ